MLWRADAYLVFLFRITIIILAYRLLMHSIRIQISILLIRIAIRVKFTINHQTSQYSLLLLAHKIILFLILKDIREARSIHMLWWGFFWTSLEWAFCNWSRCNPHGIYLFYLFIKMNINSSFLRDLIFTLWLS